MPLQATWLSRNEIERISDIRMRCYANGPADRAAFLRKSQIDRSADGDVLVLSDDTGDIATATSLRMTANVHGNHLPCQGVAWVGTVRSHRRRRVDGRGLASRVMDALAEKAAERGEVVSMLAPFRVSFYEAFGFGVVERQNTWTIPLAILPQDDTSGFAEYRDADFDASVASRQRQFDATHGDVATPAAGLKFWLASLADSGYRIVDRQGDRIASQFTLSTETVNGDVIAVVNKPFYDSPAALRRMLAMLGTLRDQYVATKITLPTDIPLNWWLAERQIPHRAVGHDVASVQAITRMQARIVDTPKFVAALRPRLGTSGVFTIAVEGKTAAESRAYRIEYADGHATATPTTAAADPACNDPTWAALAYGDLDPAWAVTMGRLTATRPQAIASLADVVAGQRPYCHEYF